MRGSVRRVVRTNSQTRMDREQRWSNVSDAFLVRRPEAVRDRHVLLVDDVIATGATIGSPGPDTDLSAGHHRERGRARPCLNNTFVA